ncbi:hypothetical protein D082_03200 [Synechocystis sp. PCC 6714]|nr:hypothetical protein D082_03200 [Synechocystis sp. PCC 6714]
MEAEATGQKTLEHWGLFGNTSNQLVEAKPIAPDIKIRKIAQNCRGNRCSGKPD